MGITLLVLTCRCFPCLAKKVCENTVERLSETSPMWQGNSTLIGKYRMKNNTVGERINSLKETDSTINSSQLRADDYTKMIYLTGKFGRLNTD